MLSGRSGIENDNQNTRSSTNDEAPSTSNDLDDEIPF